jgi:hypothetical protein
MLETVDPIGIGVTVRLPAAKFCALAHSSREAADIR